MILNEQLHQELEALAEPSYRDFAARLLPPGTPMLGVRLPRLRQLARRLLQLPAEELAAYLAAAADDTLEEKMLLGFVIGGSRMPLEKLQEHIRRFLPKIDNWSLCDSFCASLKSARKNQQALLPFLKECLASPAPYTQRFAVVMLLDYYAERPFLPEILQLLGKHRTAQYYVQMAIAWAISVFLVKEPTLVKAWLRSSCPLDDFTYNKALQKGIESRRLSDRDKDWLRSHKRHSSVTSSLGLPRAMR